jgi:formylglycine-generating enzyme required for sulfatase activity
MGHEERTVVVPPPARGGVWDAAARDADFTLALPEGIPMFFRRIKAGVFRMGARGLYADEEPIHQVVIPDDFYLGTFVVTQDQYRVVAARCPALRSRSDPSHFKRPRRPVDTVSWQDAVTFCDWLTRELGAVVPEGFGLFCLPTEAEWEYACRGGSETEYYPGDGEAALGPVGWYAANSNGETHAVDERAESHPFGLFGMHGNVWEWCHDVWDEGAYRGRVDVAPDAGWQRRRYDWEAGLASQLASGQARVLRGGSWLSTATLCRSACRFRYSPDDRNWFIGFRVCLVRGPAAGKETEAGATGAGGRGTRPEADGAGDIVRNPGRRGART